MSIEWVKDGEDVLALIISADYMPGKTDFITPLDYKQQLEGEQYPVAERIARQGLYLPSGLFLR